MTTDNKGAMTDKSVAVVRVTNKGYAMELSTYVAYALPEGMHHLYAQPAQAVPEAVDEDAAFKQWMVWHHDYDLCLTDDGRKSARAGWDARARLGIFAPVPHITPMLLANAAHCIEHWQSVDPDKRQSIATKLLKASEAFDTHGIDPVPAEDAASAKFERPATTHAIKVWPEQYDEIVAGRKTFEYRRNDRDYRAGDALHLLRFDPEIQEFTGESTIRHVSNVFESGFGLPSGYVVMALALPAESAPKLAVWYGSMPESNGKSNFTAILHRVTDDGIFGGIENGITLDRSEYPDRVRYMADKARFLIGEIDKEPFILDYDADKNSGYVPPAAPEPIHASDAPTDDAYVMDFAEVMKAKMARSREKGRDDWQDCSPDDLSRMLRDHVEKGDPVDVANFCMMLYHLGKPIATRPAPAVDAVPVHAATVTRFGVLHSTFEEPGFEKVPDAGKLYYLPAATKGEA